MMLVTLVKLLTRNQYVIVMMLYIPNGCTQILHVKMLYLEEISILMIENHMLVEKKAFTPKLDFGQY